MEPSTNPSSPDEHHAVDQSAQGNTFESEDTKAEHATTPEEITIDHETIMGILCYLGPLVLVPYFTDRDKPFVAYHIKQGFVLLGIGLGVYVLGTIMSMLFFLLAFFWILIAIAHLGILILAVVGIVHVLKRKQEPLPLIGHFANRIKI